MTAKRIGDKAKDFDLRNLSYAAQGFALPNVAWKRLSAFGWAQWGLAGEWELTPLGNLLAEATAKLFRWAAYEYHRRVLAALQAPLPEKKGS